MASIVLTNLGEVFRATPYSISPMQIAVGEVTETRTNVDPPVPTYLDDEGRAHFHLQRKEYTLAIEYLTKILQKAEEEKDTEKLILVLKNLGRAYLGKKEWAVAAKIFNSALSLYLLYPNQDEQVIQILRSQLIEVERDFLGNAKPGTINFEQCLAAKERLKALRKAVQDQMGKNGSVKEILKEFSEGVSQLLQQTVESIYPILGKPPCAFHFVGVGSSGLKAMNPYSDLEFGVLIGDDTPENREYFEKLVEWLEIRVINWGETYYPVLEKGSKSPIIAGFSFDRGGNTPRGKTELITTPGKLAALQTDRIIGGDLVLVNALRNGGSLFGNPDLYQEYRRALQSVLENPAVRQQRVSHLLQGHLVQFEPRMDKKKRRVARLRY